MNSPQSLPSFAQNPYEVATFVANLADDKKASDILVLETGKVSHLADYFVICSADSKTQVRSLTDELEHSLRQRGLTLLGQERDSEYRWCLLDYGDIVIHVMNKKERQFYQIEHFWNHANEVSRDQWLKEEARKAS